MFNILLSHYTLWQIMHWMNNYLLLYSLLVKGVLAKLFSVFVLGGFVDIDLRAVTYAIKKHTFKSTIYFGSVYVTVPPGNNI